MRAIPLLVALLLLTAAPPALASHAVIRPDRHDDAPDARTTDDRCLAVGGGCTLRAAIQYANRHPGVDVIELGAGEYRLTIPGRDEEAGATGDLDIREDVTVTGQGVPRSLCAGVCVPTVEATTVEGGGLDRVFHIQFRGLQVRIRHMVITHGDAGPASGGGGIRNEGDLDLWNVALRSNRAALGGGIYSEGSANIQRTTMTDNAATFDGPVCGGGGMANGGTLFALRVVIADNTAVDRGGGLCNVPDADARPARLGVVTITRNSSQVDGGGIWAGGPMHLIESFVTHNTTHGGNGGGMAVGSAEVLLFTVIITGNRALGTFGRGGTGGYGGGVWHSGAGLLRVTGATIASNLALRDGGGIYQSSGQLFMDESVLAFNRALADGGALASTLSDIDIWNTTFSGNEAGGAGGAMYLQDGTRRAELLHLTIAFNRASGGAGGIDTFRTGFSIRNTLVVSGVRGPNCRFRPVPTPASVGNLEDRDDCDFHFPRTDPRLGFLADNGGQTWTHALGAGSPAIDAGVCLDYSLPWHQMDQRRVRRPEGSGCDIGAYEAIWGLPEWFLECCSDGVTNLLLALGSVTATAGELDKACGQAGLAATAERLRPQFDVLVGAKDAPAAVQELGELGLIVDELDSEAARVPNLCPNVDPKLLAQLAEENEALRGAASELQADLADPRRARKKDIRQPSEPS
jgi:CSLREA domain-containing protein